MDNTEVVNFQELSLEEDDKTKQTGMPEKMAAHLKFLKTKLSPEDFAAAIKELGIKTDLTNEGLLEAIKALLVQKEQDGAEEPGKADGADGGGSSYKDFMAKCMKEGKDMATCSDDYKKQYPAAKEPTKEEAAEVAALGKKKPDEYPGPDQKKMAELETKMAGFQKTITDLEARLTQEKNTTALTSKVDELVKEKHLAPSQRDGIIALAAGMAVPEQDKLLGFFRTTQKLTGLFTDAGKSSSIGPGGKTADMTPEKRAEIIKKFHIDEIIEDKGVKRRVNS